MLVAWRLNAPDTSIQSVCDMVGPDFRARFDHNDGLTRSELGVLQQRLGLQQEPP
jgi:hypothetical protein